MMKWVVLVWLAMGLAVTSTFGIEKIVIGKDFENGGLYVPFQVEEGPDGNIYVFDAKDKAIKVYSPQDMPDGTNFMADERSLYLTIRNHLSLLI